MKTEIQRERGFSDVTCTVPSYGHQVTRTKHGNHHASRKVDGQSTNSQRREEPKQQSSKARSKHQEYSKHSPNGKRIPNPPAYDLKHQDRKSGTPTRLSFQQNRITCPFFNFFSLLDRHSIYLLKEIIFCQFFFLGKHKGKCTPRRRSGKKNRDKIIIIKKEILTKSY